MSEGGFGAAARLAKPATDYPEGKEEFIPKKERKKTMRLSCNLITNGIFYTAGESIPDQLVPDHACNIGSPRRRAQADNDESWSGGR